MIEIEESQGPTVVCRPSGDLDLAMSFSLRHVISDIVHPGCDITIDLVHVGLIDAVGLSALVGSVRRARAAGGTARVVNANPRVRWLMRLVGVDRLVSQCLVTSRPGAA